MDIVKIIGVGFIGLIMIIVLKQYKPEFSIYISIITGLIILFLVMDKFYGIITIIKSIINKTDTGSKFLGILLKITGIAILTEFAVSICKDSGETAVASKIDLGGKIIIVSISIPIITSLLELIVGILP